MTTKKSVGDCHLLTHVLDIGNVHIWAGSSRQVEGGRRHWGLRVILQDDNWAMTYVPEVTVTVNKAAIGMGFPEALHIEPEPRIQIIWPDLGAPSLTREWWQAFVEWLFSIEAETDMVIYCMGGHGRTGTALLLLALLSGAVPDGEEPLEWLRDHYCMDAVETLTQIDYIAAITGEDVEDWEPSHYGYHHHLGSGASGTTVGAERLTDNVVMLSDDEQLRERGFQRQKDGSYIWVGYPTNDTLPRHNETILQYIDRQYPKDDTAKILQKSQPMLFHPDEPPEDDDEDAMLQNWNPRPRRG